MPIIIFACWIPYSHSSETGTKEGGEGDLTHSPSHESPMFTTKQAPYGEVEQVSGNAGSIALHCNCYLTLLKDLRMQREVRLTWADVQHLVLSLFSEPVPSVPSPEPPSNCWHKGKIHSTLPEIGKNIFHLLVRLQIRGLIVIVIQLRIAKYLRS